MHILKRLILPILLLITYSGISQAPAPAGFPSPYSSNWYRVGFIQEDSGGIYSVRDTSIRPRFQGYRILWSHSGSDTSVWVFNGNKYVKEFNSQDTLGARPLVTKSFLGSQGYIKNITGFIQQGTNVSISGSGTLVSPYVISASGSGATGITQLTGDGTTGAGGGSQVLTLATVNANVGSFGDASHTVNYTVNGKGLLLASGQTSIQIGESQVTNLVSDLAGKQPLITTGSTSQYIRGDGSLATFPNNLSAFSNGPGYITGNQSISFTASGDINGTFTNPTVLTPTLTINANVVTYSKIQAAAGQGLMGSQSAGNFQLVTLGTGLIMSGGVLSVTGSGTSTGVDTLWRTPGKDSIQFTISGRYHSILDSAGGGGGINALNGLTASSQTFATGTAGTDFGISSSISTHTFNIPVASAINTGKLSNADWSTFNGKQPALSGTGYLKFSGTTPSYLTPTQVTADLNLFTTSLQGMTPASGGGTTNFLRADGTWAAPPGGGGSGTVTSVSASAPSSLLTISGSPITTSGTLVFGLANFSAHTYFGNNTGSSATPIQVTNTQLTADLNQFSSSLQGVVPASGGGTITFLRADGTWATPGGGGTVTSVGATVPSSLLTISGSPVTGSGTLAFGLANFSAHSYLGNNTGSSATPVQVTNTQLTADINQFTSTLQGVVSASGGGTTNFLRADGTWTTPGGGGTVTSVAATVPSALLTISGSPITNSGTLAFGLANGAANTAFGNFTGSSAAGAYGKIPIAAFANNTASTLNGYDNTGAPTVYSAGANISISGGQISATALPATIFNVKGAPFNAFGDGIPWSDGAMTSGGATLTSNQATFKVGDVGKYVNIKKVGSGGHPITTTITAFIDIHHVTLATTATNTASNCYYVYGHDDTQAIQAAIDSAYTHGGGQVAFPNSYYLLAGPLVHSDNNSLDPNSQLFFPSEVFPELGGPPPITIVLQGESRPTLDYGALDNDSSQTFSKGVILRSILMTNQGTGSVLSTIGPTSTFGSFSNLTPVMSNLTFITPDDTTAGAFRNAVDMGNAAWMEINNCVASTDVPLIESHAPTSHSYGFKTTNISGGTLVYMSGVNYVAGYETGYLISEHLTADNLQAAGCKYGIQAVPGNHVMHIFTAKIQWCGSSLYKASAGGLVGQVQIEQLDMEGLISGKWYDYVNAISDSANLLRGYVWYLFGASSIGTPTAYSMYGGLSYSFQSKQIQDAVLYKDHTLNGSVRNTDSTNGVLAITVLNKSLGTGAFASLQASNGSFSGSLGTLGTNYTTSGVFTANSTFVASGTNKNLLLLAGGTGAKLVISGDAGATEMANFNMSGNVPTLNMGMPVAGVSIFQAINLKNDGADVFQIGHGSSTYTGIPLVGTNGGFLYSGVANGISIIANNAAGLIKFSTGASINEIARFNGSGNLLLGTTTDNAAFLQIAANTTTRASMFLNGAASDVTSPTNGMLWYNSTTHALNFRDNGATTNLLSGGGGAVSSVSNSDGTLTISPTTGAVVASLALGHANTWTGLQTQPAPIFTGLTSAGANDSVLTIDPSTGQVHRKSGSFALFAANGLSASTVIADSFYLGGTLNQNTTISGASFPLSLGASGSNLAALNVFSNAGEILQSDSGLIVKKANGTGPFRVRSFGTPPNLWIGYDAGPSINQAAIYIDSFNNSSIGGGNVGAAFGPFTTPSVTLSNFILRNGAEGYQVFTSSTSLSTTSTLRNIYVDATSASVVISLPAVSAAADNVNHYGVVYVIKRIDAAVGNTVTIQCAGSDTIDGSASVLLTTLQSKEIQAVGTSTWYVK